MKVIYDALLKRLQTIKPLRYIDMDTGQLEVPFTDTKRPPVAYPAALISIAVNRAKEITEQKQLCNARITIRIADDTYRRTAAHQSERSRSLQIYDLVEEVRESMQGFTGEEAFSPLSRQSQEREHTSSGLFIYCLDFETSFIQ